MFFLDGLEQLHVRCKEQLCPTEQQATEGLHGQGDEVEGPEQQLQMAELETTESDHDGRRWCKLCKLWQVTVRMQP